MNDLLTAIETIGSHLIAFAIVAGLIYIPLGIYMFMDAFASMLSDKFYAKMEERRKQREYDEMITRHEERYGR